VEKTESRSIAISPPNRSGNWLLGRELDARTLRVQGCTDDAVIEQSIEKWLDQWMVGLGYLTAQEYA
jgi:hypothetical protein